MELVQLRLTEYSNIVQSIRLVPDFGGRSLDMDPDFGQYWLFCSTIIDVTTDRHPYKRAIKHHLRQRLGS